MKRLLIAFSLIAMMMGCGPEKDSHEGHDHESHDHSEGDHEEQAAKETKSNVVSFTPEQLQAGGIGEGVLEMKNLRTSIKAYGTLSVPNQNKALITTLSSGVLNALSIQPGSYVRKGQVVASITNPQIAQMQLEFQTALGQVQLFELELKRQTELVAGQAAPLKNLQRVRTELAALKASCNALRGQLTAMGILPARVAKGKISTTINLTAPISGTVSKVTARIGSAVDQNTPVAEIVNNQALHLDLFVYEKDLSQLQKGQTVHFTLSNSPEKEYDAKIYSIGTAFAGGSTTVPVHAAVVGMHSELIEGMNITALISVGQKKAVAVPTAAIVTEQGKDYIFVKTNSPEAKEKHSEGETHPAQHTASADQSSWFERVLVVKGVSDVGYSEITIMKNVAPNASIMTKGAFFAQSKMTGGAAHHH